MKSKPTLNQLLRIVSIVFALFLFAPDVCAGASYSTDTYHVDITVNENNSWQVRESIGMDFAGGHGIFRYIPYVGSVYYWDAGKEVEKPYKLKISQVSIPDYPYEKSYENDNVVFQIGDGNVTLWDSRVFQLNYRVTAHEDRIEEFDQFYWNVIPTNWNTPISKADFTITMPKEIPEDGISVYAGSYGSVSEDKVSWTRDGNVITGQALAPLQAGEGITVRILLPEGYFTGEADNEFLLPLMLALILGGAAISFLLWLLFGRDRRVVKTVEFYPPEGLSSAEVGYIVDGVVDSKDMVSQILCFANQGLLSIHEEGKDDFLLTKRSPLPAGAKEFEHILFAGLFKNGDTVKLKDLQGEFYTDFNIAKKELKAYYTESRENRIFTHNSLVSRGIACVLMMVPMATLAFLGTAYAYKSLLLALIIIPVAMITLAGFAGLIYTYDKKDSMNRGKWVGARIGFALVSAVGLAGFLLYGIAVTGLTGLTVTAAAASILSLVFTVRMKQRTRKSAELLGKILGFKEFIRTAELPRIERLAEENPAYFYHVLPFAYVFGLTDIWAKKFESIAVPKPDWYDSSFGGRPFSTYLFLSSFHHCTRSMQSNLTVPPSSGSGGFSGSSFSGGGGGFSGGGMGGGGGGGW